MLLYILPLAFYAARHVSLLEDNSYFISSLLEVVHFRLNISLIFFLQYMLITLISFYFRKTPSFKIQR